MLTWADGDKYGPQGLAFLQNYIGGSGRVVLQMSRLISGGVLSHLHTGLCLALLCLKSTVRNQQLQQACAKLTAFTDLLF